MSTTLKISDRGNWGELTLNRPEKLNAFNEEMLLALKGAIQHAIESGKRAVLLTGAGRVFCAGQDLGYRDPARKAVFAATTNSLDGQLNLEPQYQKCCGELQDYAEGVSAFLSERKPEFQGA